MSKSLLRVALSLATNAIAGFQSESSVSYARQKETQRKIQVAALAKKQAVREQIRARRAAKETK